MLTSAEIPTPLGPMFAAATDSFLCLLEFADRRLLPVQKQRVEAIFSDRLSAGRNAVIDGIEGELAEYFAGGLEQFRTPVSSPGTEFQMLLWNRLREIPFGATTTYGRLAVSIGRRGAMRAVGRANGDNRIAIVIPCHRVVGEAGQLTGYGGGIERKRRLLEHERSVVSRTQPGIGPLFENHRA